MQRSVQCWIRVVVSGLALQDKVKGLAQGQRIRVSGFLARRGHRDPEAQLELHAQQIEWLD